MKREDCMKRESWSYSCIGIVRIVSGAANDWTTTWYVFTDATVRRSTTSTRLYHSPNQYWRVITFNNLTRFFSGHNSDIWLEMSKRRLLLYLKYLINVDHGSIANTRHEQDSFQRQAIDHWNKSCSFSSRSRLYCFVRSRAFISFVFHQTTSWRQSRPLSYFYQAILILSPILSS